MGRWLLVLGIAGCTAKSAPDAATAPSDTSAGATNPFEEAAQLCVDTTNRFRAGIGLAPVERWAEEESCVGDQARADQESGVVHSAFKQCTEHAQDECTHWPVPAEGMIEECLTNMWNEGPGTGEAHSHYINMSNEKYTLLACGFYITDDHVWAVQDFR